MGLSEILDQSYVWVQSTAVSTQSSFVSAKNWTFSKTTETVTLAQAQMVKIKKHIETTDFWIENLEPHLGYKMDKMETLEWTVLGASTTASITILFLAKFAFDPANSAISVLSSMLFMMGSCTFINYRIKQAYNIEACTEINGIKAAVESTSQFEHQFTNITKNFSNMEKGVQYHHLEEDLKALNQKISEFKRDCQNINLTHQSFEDAKRAFKNYLDTLLYKLGDNGAKNITDKKKLKKEIKKTKKTKKKKSHDMTVIKNEKADEKKNEAESTHSSKIKVTFNESKEPDPGSHKKEELD